MPPSIPSASADVYEVRRGPFVVTRLHRSGSAPHRVLLIGSRRLLAPAGRARAEAFGARVTDRLWLRTQRGVDVDMVWELRPVLAAIRQGLSSARLWRYDAVVIVFADRPSGLQDRWRLRGVRQLLRRVVHEVSAATHVLLVTFDGDSAGRRRGRHAVSSAGAASAAAGSKVSHLTVPDEQRAAADRVAQGLLVPLAAADAAVADAVHLQRSHPDEEGGRQRAVDGLDLRERQQQVEQRLQRVVDAARDTFESASAELTIIDQDRQWTMAAAGEAREEMPRASSLCNRSIQRGTPTVIGDLWAEPGLRGDPLAAANDPIRFYASHPIESIDGYRIGVLCVWDDSPHSVEDFDVSALRDLALLAEAEIISATD